MWYDASNSCDETPLEIEEGYQTVYLRKDFTFIEETDTTPAHWECKEIAVPKELYPIYLKLIEQEKIIKVLADKLNLKITEEQDGKLNITEK